jgi:16S rRNA (guanine(1405)-N(7))-methyltransferase
MGRVNFPSEEELERLVEAVTANPRYEVILPALVRRVAGEELTKGRAFKETVTAVRSRLHQVGGAFQEKRIDFNRWEGKLRAIGSGRTDPALKEFCRGMMEEHTSTRERLPILEQFYGETLAGLAPIRSVVDLACGLNPLALPWMPLAEGAAYFACDIYSNLADFLQIFFSHLGVAGKAETCDLTQDIPPHTAQLALVLKTLPCLEQLDKDASLRLLDGVRAEHILVSYPVHSLGGKGKGMWQNYTAHFEALAKLRGWTYQRFEFSSELAFLVDKRNG